MSTINMEEELKKAQVLVEALPYIQKFNRKIIVVKYGGSAMVDEELKRKVIQDVVLLKVVGFKPIIVHGGGKEISKWVEKSGMTPEFKNGLRVTDEPTMEIAEMVLNKVNKSLVSLIEELGVKACGISGKDGGMLKVEKKYSKGEDIGYVGEVKEVDTTLIHSLLKDDFLPVIGRFTAYDFLAVCPEENKLHAHEDTSVKYPFLSQNECHDRNNQIAGVGVIDRSCFHFI